MLQLKGYREVCSGGVFLIGNDLPELGRIFWQSWTDLIEMSLADGIGNMDKIQDRMWEREFISQRFSP